MDACNIKYNSEESKEALHSDLDDLKDIYDSAVEEERDIDEVVGEIQDLLRENYGDIGSVLISVDNLSNQDMEQLYNDIDEYMYADASRIDPSTTELTEEWKDFRDIVMSTFFDLTVQETAPNYKQEENAMETEQEQNERLLVPIERASLDIYGRFNINLTEGVTKQFYKELKELLIIDPGLAIKHHYNTTQVNGKISSYKQDKFNKILTFLKSKEQYQNDAALKRIKGMYTGNVLNASGYYYVKSLFKQYLNSINNLNEILNDQFGRKNNLEYQEAQQAAYNKLINFIESNTALSKWFDNRFPNNRSKSEAKFLFSGDRFSNSYKVIKEALQDEIEDGNETVINLIDQIENPKKSGDIDLDLVNDFFILTQFDHLLQKEMRDYLKIDKDYIVGSEPLGKINTKYVIVEGHKLYKSGFESSHDESSERHTSANVKDLLETMHVHKYNEEHQETPLLLTLASINNAWQDFMTDMLQNNAYIGLTKKDGGVDIDSQIKRLLRTQQNDMLGNITKIFKLLFEGEFRGIDYLRGTKKLNEQQKNVLYSYYKHILQNDSINKSSYLSNEIERLNSGTSNFLELTNDLLAILHRNVNNNYLDCDTRNGTLETRAKFSWDSDLFNVVEQISSKSKTDQDNPDNNTRWLKNFTSNDKLIQLKLNTGNNSYNFGYTYGNTQRYIFTRDNVLLKANDQVTIEKTITRGPNKGTHEYTKDILDVLADIDILDFKNKLITNGNSYDLSRLTEHERLLFEMLSMFDHYLVSNFLSVYGLEVLHNYKVNYKADPKNGLYSANYLDGFLRISLRLLEAQKQAMIAKEQDMSLKNYLEQGESLYANFYEDQKKLGNPTSFSFEGPMVYFSAVKTTDQCLANWVIAQMSVSGDSARSTTRNKQEATVSNYSTARAGSKVYQRIYEYQQSTSAASKLLFIEDSSILDPDPVIDGEITTPLGDVKAVREMTEAELFSHAIVDKFYSSYINNGKVCFQPTVYSDKIQFFNYYSKLSSALGDNPLKIIMDGTDTTVEKAIDLYGRTFFGAHSTILGQTYAKLEKLQQYFIRGYFNNLDIATIYNGYNATNTPLKQSLEALTSDDYIRLYQFNNNAAYSSNRFENINNFLKEFSPEELNNLVLMYNKENPNDEIALELDKDYRTFNGRCAVNEILREYAFLSTDKNALRAYMHKQMQLYLNDLKNYGMSFKLFDRKADLDKWYNEDLPDFKTNALLRVLSSNKILDKKDRKAFAQKWVSNTGELILNIGEEVNPFIEKFFYIEGLYSNNLRLLLSGSEINHPDKSKNLFKEVVKLSKDYEKGNIDYMEYYKELVKKDVFSKVATARIYDPQTKRVRIDLNKYRNDIKSRIDDFHSKFYDKSLAELRGVKGNKALNIIYERSILDVTNTAQGTQFKRNVIIPATLITPTTGLINGMSTYVKVAVIQDMGAPVNNLRYSAEIDSQDGSAKMSPIQMLLENYSLGEHKVGVNRKPIWDAQTQDLTSFLAKFAAFGITNSSMSSSTDSTASDYNLFKKMHNLRWGGYLDPADKDLEPKKRLNLTSSIYRVKGTSVDSSRWFKEHILKGNTLTYKNMYDQIMEITDFGMDDSGNYYTMEKVLGSARSEKVYHYFDNQSNHYTEQVEGVEMHTIDSLFELFVAMGGIKSVDTKGNPSEASLEVLTNFVINVGYKKAPGNIKGAEDVVQPLKDKFVAYALNSTAVKNGAKNVNSAERWTDDLELNTFTVSTTGLGIQLNADHDVIKSEMTEFSQVVSACAAYGKEFGFTDELYYGLGQSAMILSQKELESIENYLTKVAKNPEQAKYDLYKIIGKLIINSQSNSEYDLTNQIKQEVEIVLRTNKAKPSEKDMKLPFSDPSLYRQFISSITAVINQKSIKRKHPGAAYVMVPAYNVIQYFQVYNPKTKTYDKHMFQDVVRIAKRDFINQALTLLKNKMAEKSWESLKISGYKAIVQKAKELLTLEELPYLNTLVQDIVNSEKALVRMYLNKLQASEPERQKEWFMPTDIVDITTSRGTFTHALDAMEDYYKFKNGLYDIEDEYGVIINQSKQGGYTIVLQDAYGKPIKGKEINVRPFYPSRKWGIITNPNLQEEEKQKLTAAALQLIPVGETITIVPNKETRKVDDASIQDFQNLLNIVGTELQAASTTTVSYMTSTGEVIDSDIQEYKKVLSTNTVSYKLNITKPNNLKPSLIRWQYYVDRNTGLPITNDTKKEDITTKFMTIYDHPVIKNKWNTRTNQAEIQEVLDKLHKGKFEINGREINIVEGSLENTEAELVLGNMYQEVFDTKNKSLSQVLEEGPEFFKNQAIDEIEKLPNGLYHLALLKSDGNHVLISLDNVLNLGEHEYKNTKTFLEKVPIDVKSEHEENNEIYESKGGIKIGKYIPSKWKLENEKVYDEFGNLISEDRYKIDENGKVLERINFLEKYLQQNTVSIGDRTQTTTYTVYKIGSIKDIARSFNTSDQEYSKLSQKAKEKLEKDAENQVAHIINNIYEQDGYNDIRINPGRLKLLKNPEDNLKVRQQISTYLQEVGKDTKIIKDENDKKSVENMTPEEIKKLPRFQQYMIQVRQLLLQDDFDSKYSSVYGEYYRGLGLYKKRYTSFLNSLYFISSRIPAQSLQSFMPMKCIGWTGDTNNTAYVSYIQTFLQGSDYDIDKAYIMGQSFNSGVYVGWSNLFDYSSIKTLMASKTLPLPRNIGFIETADSKYDIDEDLNNIIKIADRASRIRAIATLIRKINNNGGKYKYNKNNTRKDLLMGEIVKHDKHKISKKLREQAYKNSASANIFNVVHSIINRDQAYSDITMRDMQDQAAKSPKGLKTKQLNMVNPLTKYIMQYQNLVGKDVIGIAANGEKDWFNITYYYHKILREGNTKDHTYLKMEHTFNRIKGRASKDFVNLEKLKPTTVKIIPDLWHSDELLRTKLKFVFDQHLPEEDDKYVDQLISQLLSAATDNAKELILAKINAGTNLAKYHIHLMMMGFSLDDIVAFMTCPVVELVDKFSKSNVYSKYESSASMAVNILKGKFPLSKLIISERSAPMNEEELADWYEYQQELAEAGQSVESYSWVINKIRPIYNKLGATDLQDFFQKYLNAKLKYSGKLNPADFEEDTEFQLAKDIQNYTLPTDTDNFNTNFVFNYVNNIINDIENEISNYKSRLGIEYSLQDFLIDLEEFEKLTDQANESSTLASVWLKLNQGIPQTDEDLIKLLNNMKKSVNNRGQKFKIRRLVPIQHKLRLLDYDEDQEQSEKSDKEDFLNCIIALQQGQKIEGKIAEEVNTVIQAIRDNNPSLDYNYILNVLHDSVKYDIYGNFDIYKFLANEYVHVPESNMAYNTRDGEEVRYREMAADYYNLIKSSWNILDLVNRSHTYHYNLNLLNYSVQSRQIFANKAVIIDEILEIPEFKNRSLTPKQYKQITSYVDRLIISSFFFSLSDKPIDISMIQGAKVYDRKYDLVDSEFIHLDTLHGIDSLKHFVENSLVPWLQNQSSYKNNPLVKDLIAASYYGKDVIRTRLDLSKVYDSIYNKKQYNQYILGFQELSNEKIFGDQYSIGDILMLYNLAVHGTKVGGKFLTAVFKGSVIPDSALYDYYKFLGDNDNSILEGKNKYKYIVPTRRDLLIAIAPVVHSVNSLNYRTEPYVKVLNPMTGFDVYKGYTANGEWKYDRTPEAMIDLEGAEVESKETLEYRLYNYSKSLNILPELHRRMNDTSIFDQISNEDTAETVSKLKEVLNRYIREGRLSIYLANC